MNTVEARLRSWAGNLINGAYKKRVTEAADEITRLQNERDTLLAACWQAQPCLDPSVKGGILAIKMVRDAIALCRNKEGVAK